MHGKDAVRVGALVVAVRLLFLRVVVADFFDGIDPRQAESGGEAAGKVGNGFIASSCGRGAGRIR